MRSPAGLTARWRYSTTTSPPLLATTRGSIRRSAGVGCSGPQVPIHVSSGLGLLTGLGLAARHAAVGQRAGVVELHVLVQEREQRLAIALLDRTEDRQYDLDILVHGCSFFAVLDQIV